jgi:hypothetical protein
MTMVMGVLCACGSGGKPGPASQEPATQPLITEAEITGYWTGDWGRLVLHAKGSNVIGVYDHDDGTINGVMDGNKLVGWWCEAPSRKADKDAGDVELTFIGGPGARAIDGKWRYGSKDPWKSDWDLTWNTAEAPPELVKRFDDTDKFCTK